MKEIITTLINLQMFADPNTNVTTQQSLSAEMKTFYDMHLIEEAQANLVFGQFGQKRPIPKNGGKTIEFRKFASLPKALTPLTEGVTPDGRELSTSKIEATVSQYGDYIVQSDMLQLTAIDNTIVEATQLLGRQAGLTLDTVTRNVLCAGTNVSYARKIANGTESTINSRGMLDGDCRMTVQDVKRVVAKLKRANAPKINGDYVCIIHPDVAYDLTSDPNWMEAHKYASPEEIYNGEIGKIAGVRFVETTEAKIYRGKPFAPNVTLTVSNTGGYSGTITSIACEGGTFVDGALVGRQININGVKATISGNTTTNNIITLTFSATNFGTVADDAVIYPGEGGKEGAAVYACLFLAANAYGETEITGGGLETIVKQLGSSGVADALNQRGSIGWKATKTAEILIEPYIVRYECCSEYSDTAEAN